MAEAKNDSTNPSSPTPTLKQLTPVLIVDVVEPCIKFWTDRLGFAVNNQVPAEDGKLIFASIHSRVRRWRTLAHSSAKEIAGCRQRSLDSVG